MSRPGFRICGFTDGEVPQFVAPSAGWFFPWIPNDEIPDDGIGLGTSYPFAMSAADLIQAYWRVKQFSYTLHLTYSGTDRDGSPVSGSFDTGGTLTRFGSIDELSVAGLRGGVAYADSTHLVGMPSADTPVVSMDLTLANLSEYDSPRVITVTNDDAEMHSPAFAVDINFAFGSSSARLRTDYTVAASGSSDVYATTGLSGSFMGYAFDFQYLTDNDPASLESITVNGSMSITPSLYFPYSSAGVAIYDEATGGQLITPIPRDFTAG